MWANWTSSLWFVFVILLALLFGGGCSALHWGGEDAGRTPGVHVIGGTLLTPPELSVTSDLNAKFDKMEYVSAHKDAPSRFTLDKAEFGQSVATVVREQPAKIQATTALQHEQAVYVDSAGHAIANVIDAAAPIFNVMALAKIRTTDEGMTLTLPGGLTIGGHKVSTPADLQQYLQILAGQTAAAKQVLDTAEKPVVVPTTQPAAAPAESTKASAEWETTVLPETP